MQRPWFRLGVGALAATLVIGGLVLVTDQVTSPVPAAPPGIAPLAAMPGRTAAAAPTPAIVLGATPSTDSVPVRLVIASIGVDAPLTAKALDERGVMEVPNGPEDVAWYAFTGRPGQVGNVVLSGHVDYRGYGPAVFARLAELKPGEVVELHTADGALFRYSVTLAVSYEATTAPAQEIVGPTSRETLTLITCDGSFDGTTQQYSHRLVVRAERL